MGAIGDSASLWAYPTRNLLIMASEVQDSLRQGDSLSGRIHLRVLTVSAVGVAAIEALGYALFGGVLSAASVFRTVTCMILQGLFIGVWACIGWLSNQALVKTPLQWISFSMLQGALGFSSPRKWVAQWDLWMNILSSLGSFANAAALQAHRLSNGINAFASNQIISLQFKRMSHLILFSLSSLRISVSDPKRVIRYYGKLVEPWPLPPQPLPPIPIAQKCVAAVVEKVKEDRRVAGALGVSVVALMTILHLALPWREERAVLMGSVAGGIIQIPHFIFDNTLGRAWSWVTSRPADEVLRDQAFVKLMKLAERVEGYIDAQGGLKL